MSDETSINFNVELPPPNAPADNTPHSNRHWHLFLTGFLVLFMELACRGFIDTYCKGAKMNECERKKYRKQHGTAPPDDMMPSGQTMAAAT